MQGAGNNFKQILDRITGSTQPDQEKIDAISALMAGLNTLEQNTEISLAAETGAVLARKAGRPEMAAQFCLMRAKSEIAQAGELIAEMKNLKMAIDWFGFALEKASNRYKELERKVNTKWRNTQNFINVGYKLLNEKPYVGATAYCHDAAGQIYGQHYLQLGLYYLTTGKPWRAKIANYKISRWLGLDVFLLVDKKSRKHLSQVRKDCLNSLHQAMRLYKQINAQEYIVDTYLDLALENHSFNNPVRTTYYLFVARVLMHIHGLSNNTHLIERLKSLEELPLIGSNRDDDISRQLPDLT